jgi:predicted nucleic-acid-binding Zn-ribbon protein
MEASVSMNRKVSPYLLVIIMITLVLSLISIYQGAMAYLDGDVSSGGLYLTMGATTLAVATYLWLQTRKRMLRLSVEIPPMNTTIECIKCGFKNIRDFQKGDYVYKPVEDQCPKCNEKTMNVGSIFREVKDKEKAKEVTYGF